MKKFLVLYLTPVKVLENWMNTDPEERKATEEKLKDEWVVWTNTHKEALVDFPAGAGKTKLITSSGITDAKNDVMMYGIVQAESHEAAANMFQGHPHLQIPEATIEIMEINELTGFNG